MVTPLIGNEECAYTIINNGIFMCAFEKAWADKKLTPQTLSCHLFPVRIKQYTDFRAAKLTSRTFAAQPERRGQRRDCMFMSFLRNRSKELSELIFMKNFVWQQENLEKQPAGNVKYNM